MRVLMTTDTVGGVWTYTRELVGGLLGAGCDVALVSMGRAPSPAQLKWVARTGASFGSAFEYTATEYPLEWMRNNSGCFADSCQVLLRIYDAFRADVIHSNQFCYGALPVDVPKVVVAHSDVVSWLECCRPGFTCGEGTQEALWLERYRGLVNAGLEGAAVAVAPTRWMLRSVEASYGAPRHSAVIPNGRTIPFAAREKKLQAITAGRIWDEAKNVRILDGIETSMPVLIVGESDLSGEASFATSGMKSPAVKFPGFFTEDDLLALMAESAIYIVTSRYEPFGLAALEAALSGCVLVANSIDSLREVWSAAAVYFNDAASLAEVLKRLSEDSAMRTEMAARAFSHAGAQYTTEAMVNGYLEVYRSLVAAPPRSEEATLHVA